MATRIEFTMTVNNFPHFESLLESKKEMILNSIGDYVKTEAVVRTPVGQYNNGRVGGRLRDSIDHKIDTSIGVVYIGTDVEYAKYVEKGTSKMSAQPYLTPAAEENVGNIATIVEQIMASFGGGT